jgi:zinc transport system permease protein
VRVDLLGYLFGDILAVTPREVVGIYIGAGLALAGLIAIWRPLLTLTVHADMAAAEGLRVARTRLLFTILVALSVAIAMKVVGILLVTAMLIVPAAAMRPLARSPEVMALGAAVIGILAVAGGMAASLTWDLPAGPAIVATAVVAFLVTSAALLRRATSARTGAFPS